MCIESRTETCRARGARPSWGTAIEWTRNMNMRGREPAAQGPSDDTLFPVGASVVVTGGVHIGDHGTVIDMDPDLRPAMVWVDFHGAGQCLVAGHELVAIGPVSETDPHSDL